MSEIICKSLDLMNGEGHTQTGVSYAGSKTKIYILSIMDPNKFDFGDRLVDKRYPAHADRMKRGFVHVGVPICTQAFTEAYAEEFFEKKEKLVKVLPKFPLDAALAVATQVLNPSCFYLTNNLFPTEKLLEIYRRYDRTVEKTLWSCLQLDDVAVCDHAKLVAKTIMSLPGQWGLGVQRLEGISFSRTPGQDYQPLH